MLLVVSLDSPLASNGFVAVSFAGFVTCVRLLGLMLSFFLL